MWTLDRFPVAVVAASTGVHVDSAWLGHVEATSVRLSNGCSGAIVSAAGLVVSNPHCLIACLQARATPGHDPLVRGRARTRSHAKGSRPWHRGHRGRCHLGRGRAALYTIYGMPALADELSAR